MGARRRIAAIGRETMTLPPLLVPRKTPKWYRLRFSLRTLLLLITCVGPLALMAVDLPFTFWTIVAFEAGMIVAVALLAGTAWCASFVRPGPLAICFMVLTLISAALGISLFVGRDGLFLETCVAMTVCVCATLWIGVAFSLSWSRYAQ